jgi:acyl-CoA dehydrogenase
MMGDVVSFTAAVTSVAGLPEAVKAATDAADDVDRKSRFPSEAIDLVREAKLLSCSLPTALGGRSCSITELALIARALGGACSSAGMVFAMHHAQALALAHHAHTGYIAELTSRIAANESLLASATTELTTGGDVRSSSCAVVSDGEHIVLEKNAPVISYAEYADYICTTARRGPDSTPNDQVLVVCPVSDTTLELTSPWDVLGFRGTCSPGYILRTRTLPEFVLPVDYATISEATMLPVSHLLWSAVWLGIADAALQRARKATRAAVRKAGDKTPPQAAKLADLTVAHQELESLVIRELIRYEAFLSSDGEPTVGFTIAMNNLKLASSTAVADIVTGALQLVGINGYRENHPLSMGRLLRDCFAPQLMVSNDRIRANNAQLVLMHRG